MLLNIVQQQDTLKVSKINKKNKLEFLDLTIPKNQFFEWEYYQQNPKYNPDPQHTSWDGKPVYKKKTKYLPSFRIFEFIYGLPDEIKDEIYELNIPKVLYADIEVAYSNEYGWSNPQQAQNEVTCIGFYTSDNVATVIGTKPLTTKQIYSIESRIKKHFEKNDYDMQGFSFNYKYIESEYDMLCEFFYDWVKNNNVVTGWNFIEYDWVYLINRAKLLGVDYEKCALPDCIGDARSNYTVKHKLVVDYMKMFDKFGASYIDVKESLKLDFVAEQVIGANKIKYPGSLHSMYLKDYEKYVFYNIVDVMLVKFINDRTNVLMSFASLAKRTMIETIRTFSPVHLTEMVLCRGYLQENKVMPSKPKTKGSPKGTKNKIPGGFVKDPIPGFYEWVLGLDFASLYPSIMRLLGLSPESYIKEDELHLHESYLKTPAGTYFDTSKVGVLKKVLDREYGERKSIQGEMKEIESEVKYLESLLV